MKNVLRAALLASILSLPAMAGDVNSPGVAGCTINCPPPPCTQNCSVGNTSETSEDTATTIDGDTLSAIVAVLLLLL